MDFVDVHFVKSITAMQQRPEPLLPEIAVVGRSNVGKSSLINTVFNRRHLAKTSSRPGKTRIINYFQVEESYYLVDLPGYGFAKVNVQEKFQWQKFIESYLAGNPSLKLVLLLIDSRHGLQKIDREMIAWLDHFRIPYQVVLTKKDKLSNNQFSQSMKSIRKEMNKVAVQPFSAITREGRDELLGLFHVIATGNRIDV
jgi:GTP-binding protein